MCELSASEAKSRVSEYQSSIKDVIHSLEKDFCDMDFENANRREEMKEIIQSMIEKCNSMIDSLDSLNFEE